MNKWFLISVQYIKEFTDGTIKRVNEQYLLNAVSFTDAENRIFEEVGEYVRGEFIIKDIKKHQFEDIFEYDDAEQWFVSKISYTINDADSGSEKKIIHKYLVTAHSCKEAIERLEESLKGLLVSFTINSVAESKIVEIFIGPGFQNKMELEEEDATN